MSGVTTLAPKPAHVPDHLVVDFDFLAETRNNVRWQTGLADLFQKVGPIVWTPHNGGFWLVGGHEVLLDLARDTETFSNDNTKYPPESSFPRNLPLAMDPPEHGPYREPIVKAMTPRIIAGMAADIRAFARSLVSAFAADGRCDAVSQFTEILPISVVLRLVGLPTDRIPEWRKLMPEILNAPTAAERDAVKERVRAIVMPFIDARRARREGDLISTLLDHQIDGRHFTQEEMCGYITNLFTAGLDTVTAAMSFAVWHLAQDQPLQARLRAEPELIPDAIEEFLRRYSIVSSRRYVIRDAVFHGVEMKRFDRVAYMTAPANLDPAVYSEPERIDLDRDEAPHLAFLAGPHRCAGSHLARVEMAIAYEELLAGLPPFRLDPDRPTEPSTGWTFGLKQVPLVWEARGAEA